MERRIIGAGLSVLVSSLLLVGTASARGVAPAETPPPGTCTVKSLPSFTLQGEYGTAESVADIIEVGCDPAMYSTGSEVKIEDAQLYSLCGGRLTWYQPNPFRRESDTRGITLTLDGDGNATAAVIGGPKCQVGETDVVLHERNEPFESLFTSFSVLPPKPTPLGVTAMPSSQIEDAESSAVATIVEAEFPGASEKQLRLGSEEFYNRCRTYPGLHIITESGEEVEGTYEVNGLTLDNDGNAFALFIGDSSCYPGASLIEADLESKPFTTLTTSFTIEAPTPRDETSAS